MMACRKRLLLSTIYAAMVVFTLWQGYVLTDARRQTTEAKLHLELLVENAPVGLIATDDHGTIKMLNSQAAEMFGYKRGEMQGMLVHSLLVEPSPEAHAALMAAAAARLRDKPADWQQSRSCVPGIARKKDGTKFPLLVTVRGISVSGKIEFVAFISHPPLLPSSVSEGPLEKK